MTMPDGKACVLSSANARGGVPSAKRRFPLPSRTGLTSRTTSSASPYSSSAEVSVELPERTRSAPSFALMPRTLITRSVQKHGRLPFMRSHRIRGDVFGRCVDAWPKVVMLRPEFCPHVEGFSPDQQVKGHVHLLFYGR